MGLGVSSWFFCMALSTAVEVHLHQIQVLIAYYAPGGSWVNCCWTGLLDTLLLSGMAAAAGGLGMVVAVTCKAVPPVAPIRAYQMLRLQLV